MLSKHIFRVLIAMFLLVVASCTANPTKPEGEKKQAQRGYWQPKPEYYENNTTKLKDPVQIQVGRYSYVPAKPSAEQMNPLLTIIDVEFPSTILTVADSARYLLQYSGYHLTQTSRPSPHELALLKKPIPEVHRHFQQVVLRDALLALGGNGFRLLVDPVNRLVAFERDPKYPGWDTE